jgi:hypothetical protein
LRPSPFKGFHFPVGQAFNCANQKLAFDALFVIFCLVKVNQDRRDSSATASKRMADDGDNMTSEARAKPAYGRDHPG